MSNGGEMSDEEKAEKAVADLSVNYGVSVNEVMDALSRALSAWAEEVSEVFGEIFRSPGWKKLAKLAKRYNSRPQRVDPVSRDRVRRAIKHLPQSVVEKILS